MIKKYRVIKYIVDLEDGLGSVSYDSIYADAEVTSMGGLLVGYIHSFDTYTYMEAPHFEVVSLAVF